MIGIDGLSEPAELREVGAVRVGGSTWHVRVGMGVKGGQEVPVVDVREYVEPRANHAERSRIVGAGRRAGSARSKEPFVGWTRKGVRVELESAAMLGTLILEAAGIGETLGAREGAA